MSVDHFTTNDGFWFQSYALCKIQCVVSDNAVRGFGIHAVT